MDKKAHLRHGAGNRQSRLLARVYGLDRSSWIVKYCGLRTLKTTGLDVIEFWKQQECSAFWTAHADLPPADSSEPHCAHQDIQGVPCGRVPLRDQRHCSCAGLHRVRTPYRGWFQINQSWNYTICVRWLTEITLEAGLMAALLLCFKWRVTTIVSPNCPWKWQQMYQRLLSMKAPK